MTNLLLSSELLLIPQSSLDQVSLNYKKNNTIDFFDFYVELIK